MTTSPTEETKQELKLCIKCAHLIGNRNYPEWNDDPDKYRCGAPQNKKGVNLVTGLTIFKLSPCINQRSFLKTRLVDLDTCGEEGKWYEEYKQPIRTVSTEVSDASVPTAKAVVPFYVSKKNKKLSDADLTNL